MKLSIKPLSVNEMYYGKKFKTKEYDTYEAEVKELIGSKKLILYDKMTLVLKVGLSSPLADLDNCIKAFTDVLQRHFSFNDRQIFSIRASKEIVKKRKEYINFNLLPYKGAAQSID